MHPDHALCAPAPGRVSGRPYVLALDPGLTSGVALLAREGPQVLYSAELDFETTGRVIEHYLSADPQHIAPVAERFIITTKTGEKSQAPWSLEGIGMMRWLALRHGAGPLTLFNPSDAKAMFPNDALRRVECWHRGGAGHARDAIRHGLMYLVNTGWADRRLLGESAP